VAAHKTIVAKVVGNGICTSLPNMGPKIQKLPFQKPKPYVISLEIQATSFVVAHFYVGVFHENARRPWFLFFSRN
jgi:hypothetical protein